MQKQCGGSESFFLIPVAYVHALGATTRGEAVQHERWGNGSAVFLDSSRLYLHALRATTRDDGGHMQPRTPTLNGPPLISHWAGRGGLLPVDGNSNW